MAEEGPYSFVIKANIARSKLKSYTADFEKLTFIEQTLAIVKTYCDNTINSSECIIDGFDSIGENFAGIILQGLGSHTDFSSMKTVTKELSLEIENIKDQIIPIMKCVDELEKEVAAKIKKYSDELDMYTLYASIGGL